jgi:hypothetical protein
VANQEDENIDTGLEISDECSIMFTQTSLKIWGHLADMDFTSPPCCSQKSLLYALYARHNRIWVANQDCQSIDTGVEISHECSMMCTRTSLNI